MNFINAQESAPPSRGGTPGARVSNSQALIGMIREFGGDYFDVTDSDSLARAYEAIDEAETVSVALSHRAVRVPIYPRFLLISMALLVVGIPVGFVAELMWGTHP